MEKNTITFHQQLLLMILFILGSSILFGVNKTAGNDAWITVIFATIAIIPIVLVYARILMLFPGKNIFDIIEIVFGRIFGDIIIVLFTWYPLHLSALIVDSFSDYIEIISMPDTPPIVVMICMLSIAMYLAKNNMRTLGEWAIVAGTVVIFLICGTMFLEFKDMKFSNLFPIMATDRRTMCLGTYQIMGYPLAETVIFLSLGESMDRKKGFYKTFLYSISFSCFLMLIIVIRNLLMIGLPMVESSCFPSFATARLIEVGSFLSRIEGTISINLILAGITKITVCLICATKGLSKLFHLQDYQRLVFPTGLLVLALCSNLFENILEMFEFTDYYSFYAAPFQTLIPIMTWIGGEIYVKKHRTVLKQSNN